MRCKKHFTDLSSSVGVCATCLRERLFSLIAAQARAQQLQEDRRKSDTLPPPLIFPRSVSPYVSSACNNNNTSNNNNNNNNRRHHSLSDQLFYSTPQLGPTGAINTENSHNKKQRSRFSLLSILFRSKPKKSNSDPQVSNSNSMSSPSWFSGKLSGNEKKKQSRLFSVPEPTAGRRRGRCRDRGMSPARVSDYGDEEECVDGSSGYSSESSQGWKQTTHGAVPPVRRGTGRPSHARNVTGLTFCLSPLVRASPNRHWNQKGNPLEMGFSGEIRVPVKPHLSTAALNCANRSRKLADFGRYGHNH